MSNTTDRREEMHWEVGCVNIGGGRKAIGGVTLERSTIDHDPNRYNGQEKRTESHITCINFGSRNVKGAASFIGVNVLSLPSRLVGEHGRSYGFRLQCSCVMFQTSIAFEWMSPGSPGPQTPWHPAGDTPHDSKDSLRGLFPEMYG